jgi:hypothetical protein
MAFLVTYQRSSYFSALLVKQKEGNLPCTFIKYIFMINYFYDVFFLQIGKSYFHMGDAGNLLK